MHSLGKGIEIEQLHNFWELGKIVRNGKVATEKGEIGICKMAKHQYHVQQSNTFSLYI